MAVGFGQPPFGVEKVARKSKDSKKNSKTEKKSTGKINLSKLRKKLNKKAGQELAYDLNEDNPTKITYWIPTGSRLLDSIIARGKMAGIPGNKVTEIAGLPATGKSYMAAEIAANAQKMGISVIYFDSENAIDPDFLESKGCDLNDLIYVQAVSVETVLDMIEVAISEKIEDDPDKRLLIIWDSLAMTPTESEKEAGASNGVAMAAKAKVVSTGISRLQIPMANNNITLLVLNQLRDNISTNKFDMLSNPYFTPGGKALPYAYHLRIWLTHSNTKKNFIFDDFGEQIGSHIKAKIKKSRLGSLNRYCEFDILFGGIENKIRDEESWFPMMKTFEGYNHHGGYSITVDGKKFPYKEDTWVKQLDTDPEFREAVLKVLDHEMIHKFALKEGKLSDYTSKEKLEFPEE